MKYSPKLNKVNIFFYKLSKDNNTSEDLNEDEFDQGMAYLQDKNS